MDGVFVVVLEEVNHQPVLKFSVLLHIRTSSLMLVVRQSADVQSRHFLHTVEFPVAAVEFWKMAVRLNKRRGMPCNFAE